MFQLLHIISLVIGFGAVMVVDFTGLLWMLNKKSLKQMVTIADVTEILIWIGWISSVITGILLGGLDRLSEDPMKIKLGIVALLGLNGINLYFLKLKLRQFIDSAKSGSGFINPEFLTMPLGLKVRMMLSISLSQVGWWAVVLIGFFQVAGNSI